MDGADDRSEEELLTALRKGAFLLKHGRHGRPKVHFFRLTPGDVELRWRGASGSVKAVPLASVREFLAGQATEVFRRHPVREPAASFSLRYADASGAARTLDLTCRDRGQYSLWFRGLQLAVARAAAAAAAGAAGPGEEVIPGDVFVWGGAGGGALSSGAESGDEGDCWPRGLTPSVLPGSTPLDAAAAAIGRRHAAFISSEGSLYVLGEGRGGKLGRGHDAPAAAPHRLRRGLPPALDGGPPAVLAAACGDEYTAAVAADGQLLAWGRLPGDPLPAMIPAPLRGALAGVAVCQVACGPFHAAAVAVDGRLFTWGEGFGGKLGHGDQAPRAAPTQVAALQAMPVLAVACGVWHTAAIVLEPPGLGLHMAVSLAGSGAAAPASPAASSAPSLSGGAGGSRAAALPGAAASPHAADGTASSLDAAWTPSPHLIAPSAASAAAAITPTRAHHHRRASSSFSAGGDGPGAYQEGRGGTLYTWGGVNEAAEFETGGSGGSGPKADSNRGCLGHGEADLHSGQLTPARVGGALSGRAVRAVAAGSNFTIALTTAGAIYQMGATGAAPGKVLAPWEGAITPEVVRGALSGHFVDAIACGAHHAVALARPVERRTGRPAEGTAATVFVWGRGSEGQLGTGRWDDAAAPVAVEGALKGRRAMAVAAGGATTMVVTAHDPRKFDEVEGGKEAAEAASKALLALLEPRGGGGGSGGGAVRPPRGFSFSSVSRASASRQQQAMPPNLGRFSASSAQSSLSGGGGGGGGGALGGKSFLSSSDLALSQGIISIGGGDASTPGLGTSRQSSAALLTSQRGSMHSLAGRGGGGGTGPGGRPFSTGALSASDLGSSSSLGPYDDIMLGGTASSAALHHGRRSFSFNGAAGAGGQFTPQSAASPASKSGLDANGRSLRASPGQGLLGGVGEGGGGGDDARSSSSVVSLQMELADRGRYITRLERRLSAVQRGTTGDDGDAALRAAVAASAGQFRDSMRRASEFVGVALPPRLTAEEGEVVMGAASSAGQRQLSDFGAPEAGGSNEDLFNLARRSSSYHRDSESSAGPTASTSAVAALEADLRRKQEELEAQQRRLEAWAAELRAKEEALEASQRSEEGAAEAAAAMPPPPPPTAPTFTPPRTAAAPEPHQSNTTTPTAAPVPPQSSAFAAAVGAAVAGRHLPGEWTQQLEDGLTATFVRDPGTGTPRLKRLRFSKNVFSAASAADWYDANAHRFTADGGVADADADVNGNESAGPGQTPPHVAISLASSVAATPRSRQSVASAVTPGGGSDVVSPGVLPRPSPLSAFSAVSAAVQPAERKEQQQQERGTPGHVSLPALAHSRFDSRNMSFDARELAALHAELSPEATASSDGGSRVRRALLDGGGAADGSPAPEGSVSFGPVITLDGRMDSSGPLGSPLTMVAEGEAGSGGGSGGASVGDAEKEVGGDEDEEEGASSESSLVSASSGAAPSTGAVISPPPPLRPPSPSRKSSLHSFAVSDVRSTAFTERMSPPQSPSRTAAAKSSGSGSLHSSGAPAGSSGGLLQGMVARLARTIIGSDALLEEGGDEASSAPAAAEGAAPPRSTGTTPQKAKPAATPTLVFGGRRASSGDSASKKKRANGSGARF